MTKANLTSVILIVDRSGSMRPLQQSVINGVNEYIQNCLSLPGDTNISLIQFDDLYEVNFMDIDVKNVRPLDSNSYKPRGMTALYDAVGRTIREYGDKLSKTPENERPSDVIVVIQTDGYENSSREYTVEKIKSMIEHQTGVYSWRFVFLGANQDAILTASSLGINAAGAMTFNANDVSNQALYSAVTSYTRGVKTMGSTYDGFTDNERASVRQ